MELAAAQNDSAKSEIQNKNLRASQLIADTGKTSLANDVGENIVKLNMVASNDDPKNVSRNKKAEAELPHIESFNDTLNAQVDLVIDEKTHKNEKPQQAVKKESPIADYFLEERPQAREPIYATEDEQVHIPEIQVQLHSKAFYKTQAS